MIWKDFWFGGIELPIWAIALRAIILYVTLIIATRCMRQRQIGILSGHNYLVAAGIVSLAAVRMVNPNSSLFSGIVIIILYAAINILLSFLDVKIPKEIDRSPVILINNGKIIKQNLLDNHITIDNLLGQLRLKGIFNLSEINVAILEPTGKINVAKKAQSQPVTRKQMKLPYQSTVLPKVLINDGKIQEDTLKSIGYDSKWLYQKIREKGFTQPKDIFIALLESNGTLYIS